MTKRELIRASADVMGATQAETNRWFDVFRQQMEHALLVNGSVTIRGFGTISVRELPERMGVHPRTLKKMKIPAVVTAGFRPAKSLKRWLTAEMEFVG